LNENIKAIYFKILHNAITGRLQQQTKSKFGNTQNCDGSVTITIEVGTNGATTIPHVNFLWTYQAA